MSNYQETTITQSNILRSTDGRWIKNNKLWLSCQYRFNESNILLIIIFLRKIINLMDFMVPIGIRLSFVQTCSTTTV